MNVYGKQNAVDIISAMKKNNRLAHSFLIWGEKGTGKKFLSKYTAMLIMCNNSVNGKPCLECRSCRNIMNDVHTDVIYAEHSGKLNGFRKEIIEEICRNSIITPNDAERKVYIFNDADAITVQAQNTLLKTIEEPSDFSYFIFTASSKNIFLDTILSRVVSVGITECSIDETRKALNEMNFKSDEIENAVSLLGGNIGNCISYITDEKFRNIVELTKVLADCIINNNEYIFLKTISDAESDREIFKTVVYFLDRIIRDSMIMKFNENISSGFYHNGAVRMSETVALSKCEKIHYALENALECVSSNVNIRLVTSALCGNIAGF